MPEIPIKRALIAVYDKTGIADFARTLVDEFGIEIISTGGTAGHLKEAGIPVTMVEEVTGFPEMLDGRVKTLHPKIHAAILADRDNPEHMRQLAEQGIAPIDMVVVNLYPFEETIKKPGCTFEEAIEMIDIGGPCLLRAAAKNHKHVCVLTKPDDVGHLLRYLREPKEYDEASHAKWIAERAWETYWMVSRYDASIAQWLSSHAELVPYTMDLRPLFMEESGLERPRYGENPHQQAQSWDIGLATDRYISRPPMADEIPMSYNNLVDADAALDLCAELTRASMFSGSLPAPRGGEPPARAVGADARASPPAAPRKTNTPPRHGARPRGGSPRRGGGRARRAAHPPPRPPEYHPPRPDRGRSNRPIRRPRVGCSRGPPTAPGYPAMSAASSAERRQSRPVTKSKTSQGRYTRRIGKT